MRMVSFETLWKILKIFLVIQIFNAIMDYYVWVVNGYLVPSWAIATINLFYIVLIVGVKAAMDREKTKQTHLQPESKPI